VQTCIMAQLTPLPLTVSCTFLVPAHLGSPVQRAVKRVCVCIVGDEAQWSKGKVFPYSLPSVGPGADPGVQAVSPQVT